MFHVWRLACFRWAHRGLSCSSQESRWWPWAKIVISHPGFEQWAVLEEARWSWLDLLTSCFWRRPAIRSGSYFASLRENASLSTSKLYPPTTQQYSSFKHPFMFWQPFSLTASSYSSTPYGSKTNYCWTYTAYSFYSFQHPARSSKTNQFHSSASTGAVHKHDFTSYYSRFRSNCFATSSMCYRIWWPFAENTLFHFQLSCCANGSSWDFARHFLLYLTLQWLDSQIRSWSWECFGTTDLEQLNWTRRKHWKSVVNLRKRNSCCRACCSA